MNLPAQDHRLRLLRALEHVLSEKSYRDVTLSDITAAAKVSRRTFYEHFANKDECLLALSEDTCQRILTLVIASFSLDDDWPGVVTKVTRTYLSFIDAHPSLMLALYVETSTLGQAGLASRRKVSETFAEFLRSQTAIRSARGEEVDDLLARLALLDSGGDIHDVAACGTEARASGGVLVRRERSLVLGVARDAGYGHGAGWGGVGGSRVGEFLSLGCVVFDVAGVWSPWRLFFKNTSPKNKHTWHGCFQETEPVG